MISLDYDGYIRVQPKVISENIYIVMHTYFLKGLIYFLHIRCDEFRFFKKDQSENRYI